MQPVCIFERSAKVRRILNEIRSVLILYNSLNISTKNISIYNTFLEINVYKTIHFTLIDHLPIFAGVTFYI